jgi:hypothetical protein
MGGSRMAGSGVFTTVGSMMWQAGVWSSPGNPEVANIETRSVIEPIPARRPAG